MLYYYLNKPFVRMLICSYWQLAIFRILGDSAIFYEMEDRAGSKVSIRNYESRVVTACWNFSSFVRVYYVTTCIQNGQFAWVATAFLQKLLSRKLYISEMSNPRSCQWKKDLQRKGVIKNYLFAQITSLEVSWLIK